jgi:hypothetical protein
MIRRVRDMRKSLRKRRGERDVVEEERESVLLRLVRC